MRIATAGAPVRNCNPDMIFTEVTRGVDRCQCLGNGYLEITRNSRGQGTALPRPRGDGTGARRSTARADPRGLRRISARSAAPARSESGQEKRILHLYKYTPIELLRRARYHPRARRCSATAACEFSLDCRAQRVPRLAIIVSAQLSGACWQIQHYMESEIRARRTRRWYWRPRRYAIRIER